MSFYEWLVYARKRRVVGRLAYWVLKLLGVEIPLSVEIGPGFRLHHGGMGVVIHPKTVIGANVGIYPGVTLGRADVYRPAAESRFEGIIVEEGAILGAGAKILCDDGVLRVGRGTVVGANAVLLRSTGEYELWAGIPARKVGERMAKTDGESG